MGRYFDLRPAGRALFLVGAMLFVPVANADNVRGKWLSPGPDNWPLIAIHAALTPDGRVLTYGTDGTGRQTGYFVYDVWDPAQGLSGGHITLDNITLTDLFCSSQVVLPQSGSILIAGGDNWTGTSTTNTGNNNSNVFRFTDDTLSRGNNMNRARWYSSATVLTNGEVYIQGGSGGHDRPEVRDLDGNFRLLSNADTSALASLFPRNFVAPDSRVFGYDTNGVMYYVDPTGLGQRTSAGQFSSAYAGWTSSAAMFRPGRILQLGGNSNGAVVIDITSGQPVVTPTQSMSTKRQWVSATVIADGRVVATGGSEVDNQLTGVNNSAEIWDPATGQWIVGPSGSRARLYHSGALLLPDASVLVAGGGAPGPLVNRHAEIYYPPYLFDASGNFAARPAISNAPDTVDLGQSFTAGVGSADIRRVTLVKTGSVTHSVNMDQRFIELTFTASSGTLFVQAPSSAAQAPPGYYLMFAINAQGVPSVGKILRINIPAAPGPTPVNYTSVVGGGGGNPFVLACQADEVLVGAYGYSAGTYINQVGTRCVKLDSNGRWIGDPVSRGITGVQSGTAFTRTCQRDSAISGFKARAAQYVDQLDFECRSLTSSGQLTGSGQFLGPAGGTGGTAQGPFSCSTGNPAYAVNGRSGSWLDAFGMQCRQAPLAAGDTNAAPQLTAIGNQAGTVGTALTLQVAASDPDGDPLTYGAVSLPLGLSISTAGLISGVPTSAGTSAVTVTVSDGQASASSSFAWTIADTNPLVLEAMPKQPPRPVNTAISYTATSRDGVNTRYRWYFDDGTESNWSTSPTVTHTFPRPTVYWVAVTARDDRGMEQTQTFSQLIHLPLTAGRPAVSGNLAVTADRLWVVNQDNDSVGVFSLPGYQKLAEVPVGLAPRALAIAPDGEVWVTNKRSASISVINPSTLAVSRVVGLPRASQPFGIVFGPDGAAYVALEAVGRVVKLDRATGSVSGSAEVGASPRHLSLPADGSRIYVSRFITPRLPGEHTANVLTETGAGPAGGEIIVLNPATMVLATPLVLRHSDDPDSETAGSGVPNYLGPVVISPDGASAWVPSKKDNVKRGTLRSGFNLNFQNTVRAISSRIDLTSAATSFGVQLDHDNASLASAAAFDRYGVFLFVALETSREVAVVDAHNRVEFFRIGVGRAPQGLAVSADGYRLYVSNFMDRTVGVYDLTRLVDEGQWQAPLLTTLQPVGSEKLTASVLKGKQFFYDARDTRLAREGYMSCASCHNDGGQDGRVWDLTGLGEGLRSTVALRGRAGGQGFLHWSGNFDEVQDFEGQIRQLAGGTGLMADAAFTQGTRSQPLGDAKAGLSADLDALAAYVASLGAFEPSPLRNTDGSLTSAGAAGRTVFEEKNCSQCHGGASFTVSGAATLSDIGTISQPTSGQRLGGTLVGIDPPTLRDVWAMAPYLHDGSAATLEVAVLAHRDMSLTAGELSALVAFLGQIDGTEPAPRGPNVAPVITNPGSQTSMAGTADSLQLSAADANGDTLTYQAAGLPPGLSINATTGGVGGTPNAAGTFTVTAGVNDGRGGTDSESFTWTVEPANALPVVQNPGSQRGVVGRSVQLQIVASDADGQTLRFSATGLPAGLDIDPATGMIRGTLTRQGGWNVTVRAEDTRGGVGSTLFKWQVSKR